jgi:hypothetical protein
MIWCHVCRDASQNKEELLLALIQNPRHPSPRTKERSETFPSFEEVPNYLGFDDKRICMARNPANMYTRDISFSVDSISNKIELVHTSTVEEMY